MQRLSISHISSLLLLLPAIIALFTNSQQNKVSKRTLQESPPTPTNEESSIVRSFLNSFWQTTRNFFDCGGGTSGPSGEFTISLELQGISNKKPFQNAQSKWSQVIVGNLPDFNGKLPGESKCGPWPTSIDDVYICAKYESIDGSGGVLGSAGPRHYRQSNNLPLTGEMRFDNADVSRINDMVGVILHEMGHVLGIGSLWKTQGLTQSYEPPCPYQINSAASREFQKLSGCSGQPIPTEQNIASSNCGHWSESCLREEVMTSAANQQLPLSRLTIAGLEDLGYRVDYSVADDEDYNAGNLDSACRCKRRELKFRHDNADLSESLPFLSETEKEQRQPGVILLGSHSDNKSPSKSSSKRQKRNLSEEGYQEAVDYGLAMLEENRAAKDGEDYSEDIDAIDLGSELIFVLYVENDDVFSVLVTAPELA